MKLSEKSRKLLRNIYRILGVTTVSIIVQACYGMPMTYELSAAYGMPPNWEEDYPSEESDQNDNEEDTQ